MHDKYCSSTRSKCTPVSLYCYVKPEQVRVRCIIAQNVKISKRQNTNQEYEESYITRESICDGKQNTTIETINGGGDMLMDTLFHSSSCLGVGISFGQ